MSVLLLLPKAHRPGQLGKKGGAKAEFLPKINHLQMFFSKGFFIFILYNVCIKLN